jgi:hypothetical protein
MRQAGDLLPHAFRRPRAALAIGNVGRTRFDLQRPALHIDRDVVLTTSDTMGSRIDFHARFPRTDPVFSGNVQI